MPSLGQEAVGLLFLGRVDLRVGPSRVGGGSDAIGLDLSENAASCLDNGRDERTSVRILLQHLLGSLDVGTGPVDQRLRDLESSLHVWLGDTHILLHGRTSSND